MINYRLRVEEKSELRGDCIVLKSFILFLALVKGLTLVLQHLNHAMKMLLCYAFFFDALSDENERRKKA